MKVGIKRIVLLAVIAFTINTTKIVDAKEEVELIPQPGIQDEEWRKEMFGDVPEWYSILETTYIFIRDSLKKSVKLLISSVL